MHMCLSYGSGAAYALFLAVFHLFTCVFVRYLPLCPVCPILCAVRPVYSQFCVVSDQCKCVPILQYLTAVSPVLYPSEALVEYDYEAQHTDELTIRVGDVVTDLTPTEPGWMRGKLRGKVGVFPDNFVKVGHGRD